MEIDEIRPFMREYGLKTGTDLIEKMLELGINPPAQSTIQKALAGKGLRMNASTRSALDDLRDGLQTNVPAEIPLVGQTRGRCLIHPLGLNERIRHVAAPRGLRLDTLRGVAVTGEIPFSDRPKPDTAVLVQGFISCYDLDSAMGASFTSRIDRQNRFVIASLKDRDTLKSDKHSEAQLADVANTHLMGFFEIDHISAVCKMRNFSASAEWSFSAESIENVFPVQFVIP